MSRDKATASRPAPPGRAARPRALAARCAGHGAASLAGDGEAEAAATGGRRRGAVEAVEHALAQPRASRPGPASWISTRRWPSGGLDEALASISPPGGLWRMALSSKLPKRLRRSWATPLSETGPGAWSTKAMSSWRSSAGGRGVGNAVAQQGAQVEALQGPRCRPPGATGSATGRRVACAGHALHAAVGLGVGHGRRAAALLVGRKFSSCSCRAVSGVRAVRGRRPARSGVAPQGPVQPGEHGLEGAHQRGEFGGTWGATPAAVASGPAGVSRWVSP